jgi:hypothetical protein
MNQLLEDLSLLFSSAPETAVNTPYTTAGGFKVALFNSFMPPIPRPDKLKSSEIGAGNEFGQKGRNGYWPPNDIPIGGLLNTEFAAVLAARCFSGTVTDTVVTTAKSWDHTVALQTKAQGRVPKLTSILPLLGGYDFLHASCAVENFRVTFGGNAYPQYQATLRNTGYSFTRNAGLGTPIVPGSAPTHHYLHPAGVKATYNNGSLIDLGSLARLVSGMCELNNNIVVTPMPQDPFKISGNPASGAYARVINRGKRTAAPTLKSLMDETLAEWLDVLNSTDITALTYLFQGDIIAGTTADRYEFEVTYPLSTMSIQGDTEGANAAIALSFDTDRSDASPSIAQLRVRNDQATLV